MKKPLVLGLLAFLMIPLSSCKAQTQEEALLFTVSDKTLTNAEFGALASGQNSSILFVEACFDFFYRGLDDVKLYLADHESVTQEEADSLWKEARLGQNEYYQSKNQEMADRYSLSSICDSLEISDFDPSVELIYLDGKIEQSEANVLNLLLKDTHTVSVDFYLA